MWFRRRRGRSPRRLYDGVASDAVGQQSADSGDDFPGKAGEVCEELGALGLSRLLGTAGRRPFRLPEHEIGRCLRPFELRDRRDDIFVPVEDEQEVRAFDLTVGCGLDYTERECRATVLRVALVVEVEVV